MKTRAAVLVLALTAVAARAAALDVALDPYAAALAARATATVEGRAFEESRTPTGPDQPLRGTAVWLLPRSEEMLRALEELKRGARRSVDRYRVAAAAMRGVKDDYERSVWEAGMPHLVLATTVDADGRFRLDDVPAGAWILFGWHARPFDVKDRGKTNPRDEQLYRLPPRTIGYDAVTIWVRELTVTPPETTALSLNDRNAWFSGVVEEQILSPGR